MLHACVDSIETLFPQSPAPHDDDTRPQPGVVVSYESLRQLSSDVEAMKHSITKMGTQINDALDAQAGRAGKGLSIRLSRVDVIQTLTNTLREYELLTSVPLKIDLQKWEQGLKPKYISTDGYRLQQLIANGLSNAVKVTDNGEITLRPYMLGSPSASSPSQVTLVVEVEDSGPGLQGRSPTELFKRFSSFQAPTVTSTHRALPSSGLGLAICRQIADAMNGSISLRDKCPGGNPSGALFTIAIPVVVAHSPRSEQRRGSIAGASAKEEGLRAAQAVHVKQEEENKQSEGETALRALVVDDLPHNVQFAKRILTRMQCEVIGVSGGDIRQQLFSTLALAPLKEAATSADTDGSKPQMDVVFLDIEVGDDNGLDILNALQSVAAEQQRSLPPVVAMTASTRSADIARYKAAGFAGLMPKPFTVTAFRELLIKLQTREELW